MYQAALLLSSLLLVGEASAQEFDTPSQVIVSHQGEDQVGRTLAYELREEIKSSAQMRLVNPTVNFGVRVALNTMDPYKGGRIEGQTTIFSCTLTYVFSNENRSIELFITSTGGRYGSENLESGARALTALTDEAHRKVPKILKDMALLWQDVQRYSEQ